MQEIISFVPKPKLSRESVSCPIFAKLRRKKSLFAKSNFLNSIFRICGILYLFSTHCCDLLNYFSRVFIKIAELSTKSSIRFFHQIGELKWKSWCVRFLSCESSWDRRDFYNWGHSAEKQTNFFPSDPPFLVLRLTREYHILQQVWKMLVSRRAWHGIDLFYHASLSETTCIWAVEELLHFHTLKRGRIGLFQGRLAGKFDPQ